MARIARKPGEATGDVRILEMSKTRSATPGVLGKVVFLFLGFRNVISSFNIEPSRVARIARKPGEATGEVRIHETLITRIATPGVLGKVVFLFLGFRNVISSLNIEPSRVARIARKPGEATGDFRLSDRRPIVLATLLGDLYPRLPFWLLQYLPDIY